MIVPAALLNTMGKELGLRVEIVPTVRGGSANGQYVASRNLIQILHRLRIPVLAEKVNPTSVT